jgi:hypothetical protein
VKDRYLFPLRFFPILPADLPIWEKIQARFPYPSREKEVLYCHIVPSLHPPLAEEPLLEKEGKVKNFFYLLGMGKLPERRKTSPLLPVFLSVDDPEEDFSYFLMEWIWTLKIRRIQYLRENPSSREKAGITEMDLLELDELYETEYFYTRGRRERKEIDGGGIFFILSLF